MLVFVILALVAVGVLVAYRIVESKPKQEEASAPIVVEEPKIEVKKAAPKAKAPKAPAKKAAKSAQK